MRIQPLADRTPLFHQLFDVLKMGCEAVDFFRNIDTNRIGRGFEQGTFHGGIGATRCRVVAGCRRHGIVPALKKARALQVDQLGHQRLGLFDELVQVGDAFDDHAGQLFALGSAGSLETVDQLPRHRKQPGGSVARGLLRGRRKSQDVGHADWLGIGNPGPNRVLQGGQALEHPGTGFGGQLRPECFRRNTQFHFAPTEFSGQ